MMLPHAAGKRYRKVPQSASTNPAGRSKKVNTGITPGLSADSIRVRSAFHQRDQLFQFPLAVVL